jgi:hypothetical protein
MVNNSNNNNERFSVQEAKRLEDTFKRYPPRIDYDEYMAAKSNDRMEREDNLYMQVLFKQEEGLELTTGVARWNDVAEKMLDALDIVLTDDDLRESWLETFGTDRRNILSKCCLTLAQTRGIFLDPTKHIAWGKAAVAGDPEYWNAHNILSLGYEYDHEYEKSLKSLEIAKSLGGWKENIYRDGSSSMLMERFDRLYDIVHGDQQDANDRLEWTLWSRKNLARRAYRMQGVPEPSKRCNACFWPGDHRCSTCKSHKHHHDSSHRRASDGSKLKADRWHSNSIWNAVPVFVSKFHLQLVLTHNLRKWNFFIDSYGPS